MEIDHILCKAASMGFNEDKMHPNQSCSPVSRSNSTGAKVFVDASLKEGVGTGVGFIVVDSEGVFMAAAVRTFPEALDARTTEALGVLWCIETLMEIGISHVTIHTDYLQVVQFWKKKRWCHTYFEEIIQDSIDKGKELHDLKLVHVRRNLNKIANFLANFAFDSTSTIWLDEVPSLLQQLFNVVFNVSVQNLPWLA
ncbi:hypothetical protein RIF29_34001 [Crotalaria pallida]|uniref:RNase H type-1 domain-containing protein n=1 Tax=Crotalaria pallida TaxID=3830 RepID=A0AAN9E8F9_CROPI